MNEQFDPIQSNIDDEITIDLGAKVSGQRKGNWYLIRLLAMILGAILFIGAVVLIINQQDRIEPALQAIGNPGLKNTVILIASMLAGLFLTGLQFQLLMARHHIPMLEMQGLIVSSALLNFLPMKAGLLGRIAYHQVSHGIHPLETTKAMILARIAGLAIIGMTACALFLRDLADGPLWAWALLPAFLSGWLLMPQMTRVVGMVLVLKYLDLILMAVRYHYAFQMMDQSIGFDICIALASIGMLAGAIPFLSGGLGLREWLVGWLTTILVMLPASLELGIMADLINRASELVVVLPLGVIAILWLRPRFMRALKIRESEIKRLQSESMSTGSPDPQL